MNMQDYINLSLAMRILMAVHQRQTLEHIAELNKSDICALDAISKLADIVGEITK